MFEIIAQVFAYLFDLTHSYALAIILLTVLVRLLLLPLTLKQTRSMQGMAKLQPEIKKLQEKHGSDRQAMNEEVMRLYKEHKVNPAGGCLPLLLQAPIFIGLYRVVNGLTRNVELSGLMIRVAKPQYLSADTELYRSLVRSGGAMKSFGIDLAQSAQGVTGSALTRLPYVLLVVLVGVTGYVQQVITNKQQGPPATAQAAQMQRTMKYLPVFFAFISFNIQAAVVLYWIVGNLWIIVQGQILRKLNPPEIATAAVDAKPVPAAVEAVSDSKQESKQESKQASTRTASNGAAGKNGSRKGGLAKGDPVSGRSTTRTTTSGSEGKTPSSAGAPTKQSAIAAAKQAAREGRSKRTGSPDEQNKGR
jgi:YidC/Oxa1 family membrane protein insertase